MQRIPRQAVYISTTIGRYTRKEKPIVVFDYSADRTRNSIDISLKKLGTDYIDLIIVS